MKQRHSIVFAAAFAAATLMATAAGAATPGRQASSLAPPAAHEQHKAAAQPAPQTTGSASVDTFRAPGAAFQLHGVLGCAPAASPNLDCGKLENLLAK